MTHRTDIWKINSFLMCVSSSLCWFKLSGRNEQNLNFQTRFSQIGLRLDKKWRGQKLLRISSELIWCHFFSEILNTNFGVKFVLRISEKKWHHINSGEILSNFCPLHFLSNLNPIWEKCVWKFKFCSFCPDNLNQHCTTTENIALKLWQMLDEFFSSS